MDLKLGQQWYKVGNTNIYTTGHYLAEKSEVKAIFKSDIFDNGDNLEKIENNQLVTTKLKSNRRILFSFIPLKTQNKFLMEGNASRVALEEIEEILPKTIKQILIEKRRVRYKAE